MKKRNRHGDPHAPADTRWGKKFLALFLSAAMCMTMLPSAAFAAEVQPGITSTEVTTAMELESAVASNGTITLANDITISNTLTIANEITLDLNGHVLKYENSDEHGSVITVGNAGNLTLKDSTSNKGEIIGGTGSLLNSDNNTSHYVGGGVYVDGGAFTMDGGRITGCTANAGGGVYVDDGTFNMTGGTISGNTVTDGAGGGVYLDTSSPATISDATFDSNKVKNNTTGITGNRGGSAIYAHSSVTIQKSDFRYNVVDDQIGSGNCGGGRRQQ